MSPDRPLRDRLPSRSDVDERVPSSEMLRERVPAVASTPELPWAGWIPDRSWRRPSKRTLRVVLLVGLLVAPVVVGSAWASRPSLSTSAPPADGVTVITAQGRRYLGDGGRLVAFAPNGSMLYQHTRYSVYFDVDPVPNTTHTVEYVAVDHEPPGSCPPRYTERWCSENYVLRTNLSTGETEVVYVEILPKLSKIHDVDRINDTHILIADIVTDSVRMVDLRTNETVWRWTASEAFPPSSGGPPDDWTHINDVELVRNGLVMLSLRNQDQVVFVDPGNGIVRNLTLGCDDCHGVLYEQHNPDYLATDPPAILVADSENNRIVEYRRRDGEWVRSWSFTGPQMFWPRDADRLPNGNTLVVDSNANRVIEVAPNGSIVWQVTIGNPYEAERLGTGDESVDRLHRPGVQVASGGLLGRAVIEVRQLLPAKAVSSALFVLPYWAGFPSALAIALSAVALLALVALEIRWYWVG